jgi:signal transduction histidine kinase
MTFFYILSVIAIYLLDASVYVLMFSVSDVYQRLYLYVCVLLAMALFILIALALISEIKLRYYIAEMAAGHIETIPRQRAIFTNSINRLNNVNTRFQENVEKTLKNERLKTDLITNVSHDLKTPLTSIINYIDLLKELNLDNERAVAYIDVVDKKSRRLKLLIEDLFEASKLSSGQMELELHPTDILALLNQTMGELSDRMEEAGIEFKVSAPKHPVMINMDGQKMWRVFDNMFNNILKYAPNGSRAYVEVEDNAHNVVVTLKNVANYQMDFDADELFERFKRGDKARTTEGSGLGLSIAKGIVELHGGNMRIVTDGDLFKMIITLYK